jgi:hypothetical protein
LTATSRTGIVGGGLGFTLSSWVYRTRTDRSWDRVIDFGQWTTRRHHRGIQFVSIQRDVT